MATSGSQIAGLRIFAVAMGRHFTSSRKRDQGQPTGAAPLLGSRPEKLLPPRRLAWRDSNLPSETRSRHLPRREGQGPTETRNLCYPFPMFEVFRKPNSFTQAPRISVGKSGIGINKAAMVALLGAAPLKSLHFLFLTDPETGLYAIECRDIKGSDTYSATRPGAGATMGDGTRKPGNTWRITAPHLIKSVGLCLGRYTPWVEDERLVFGPDPE